MRDIEFSLGSECKKDRVTFFLKSYGRDWILYIFGGEGHIGSVACSDKQVKKEHHFDLNSHKEGKLVKRVLNELKNDIEGELLVIAGIHFDFTTRLEIEKILKHVDQLTKRLKTHLISFK